MIMARSRDNERFVGVKLPEDLRADPKGGPVINTRDLDGTEVLHAVTRSQVSGWGVGVSVPAAFLEQQLRRSLWLLVAMSAVAVILAVVLGALFARQLTAPLAAASAAAVALGRGHPLKISSSRLKEANTVTQALVAAQGELSRRTSELRESEARKSAILESALDAIIAMDRDGTIVDFNPAAEQLFGFARDRVLGKPLADTIIPERLREAHRRGLQSFLETGQGSVLGRRVEVPALRADGTEFEAELAISTTHLTDGQILFTGCLRDVTERKRAAQAEEMLVHELHHRTNNLLAVVQAIAKRSLSGSGSLNEAKAAFEARLQALAQAHRQLGKSNWTGVSFGEIVRESLEPFAAQTAIDGPNVIVGSQDAQNFTLAVHELATNAVKHGALSRATGTVDISWDVSADGIGPVLTFKWQERGGPPVAAPERRGFGTALLRASFPEISLDYAPDGLVCEIKVPLRKAELPLLPATAERSSRITPYAR
jgi:PAS domain S-box-containing protein